jgi:hypothetical protein
MGRLALRLLASVAFAVCVLGAASASASPGGALEAHGLFDPSVRFGGAITADVWYGRGRFKGGGVFGVGALSAGDGQSSRVLTPVGGVFAFVPEPEQSGLTLLARGGMLAGAKKGGFTLEPWLSGAVGYAFSLGEGASVRAGLEVWGMIGRDAGLLIAPTFGFGF